MVAHGCYNYLCLEYHRIDPILNSRAEFNVRIILEIISNTRSNIICYYDDNQQFIKRKIMFSEFLSC